MEYGRPHDAVIFGVPALDAQHQHLQRLVRQMEAALAADQPPRELRRLAAVLTLHVRLHFMDEEMFMDGAGYPGLPGHRRRHQEFTEGLLRLQATLHPRRKENFKQIVEYELRWITQHLDDADHELGAWLRQNESIAAPIPAESRMLPSPIPITPP